MWQALGNRHHVSLDRDHYLSLKLRVASRVSMQRCP